MRRAVIVSSGRAGADGCSIGWRQAFAAGLRRRGWSVELSSHADPADLLVMWGVRRQDRIARQKAADGEVCILERGYLGDRHAYSSVSFGGGLNGRGEFRVPDGIGMERLNSTGIKLTPWVSARPDGYALIMGQVPGDMSIRDTDIEMWYLNTSLALQAGGMAVRFRPHPLAGRRGPTGNALVKIICGTLSEALAGAAVVVTFNSNSGVDAAIAGRPVVAMDRGSMAWDIAGHEVTEIRTPDRTAWAARLAWCQFTKEEMESGFCAEAVGL